jgi:hypothetical protein
MNQAGIWYLREFRVPENFREGLLCKGVEGEEVFVYADLVVQVPMSKRMKTCTNSLLVLVSVNYQWNRVC